MRPTRILFFIALLVVLGTAPAYAYLDPGSGSILFQIIIGGVVTFFYTLKVYWKQVKNLFSQKFPSKKPPTR